MSDNVTQLPTKVDGVDIGKTYACYFCEGSVEYSTLSNVWVHLHSGMSACGTSATPSNMEVIQ